MPDFLVFNLPAFWTVIALLAAMMLGACVGVVIACLIFADRIDDNGGFGIGEDASLPAAITSQLPHASSRTPIPKVKQPKSDREQELENAIRRICEAQSAILSEAEIECALAKVERRSPENWALDVINELTPRANPFEART